MKNFVFFNDVNTYVEHVKTVIFTDQFSEDLFYGKVIDFIIENRTPMFFEMSNYKVERSHFTQSFGLFPMRDEYANPTTSGLFYLHDFMHLMMSFPQFPRSVLFDDFVYQSILNEHAISNETEVLTYVRHPEWRKNTFAQAILYDILTKIGWEKWNVRDLIGLRRSLASSSANWDLFRGVANEEEIAALRRFMDKQPSNLMWCSTWYMEFPKVALLHDGYKLSFTPYNYEEVGEYNPFGLSQSEYENQMLINVIRWHRMAGCKHVPDAKFNDIPAMLADMEGKIIMPKSAEIYSKILEL